MLACILENVEDKTSEDLTGITCLQFTRFTMLTEK